MLELSQKSKYALTLLTFLAQQDQGVYLSVKSISSLTGLPYRFLSQIAAELKHAGLIDAKEGKGGGYYLKRDLSGISLKDIVESVDGSVGLVSCQVGEFCGNANYCQNRSKWDQIRDEVTAIFDKYKLDEIM